MIPGLSPSQNACHTPEQAKIQYEQYLKEHIEQIASDFIRQKRGEELEWLLHTYPLEQGQKELFTGLVNLADTVKSPEILSMQLFHPALYITNLPHVMNSIFSLLNHS